MREEEAIRSYFGQPGFARFLKLLERNYKASSGGTRGYVTLTSISDLERSTLDTFFKTYSPPIPGETKRYSLKKFEQLLKESRFELTVPELLAVLHGEPVLTGREQAMIQNEEWRGVIESSIRVVGASNDSRIDNWARGLIEESSPGSRTLRIVFGKSQEEAKRCLTYCLTALHELVGRPASRPIRLPVFSALITGDSHAFDWKNPLGRLFWWGLTAIHEQPSSGIADEDEAVLESEESSFLHHSQAILIREGYRRGGIADDDLSTQVMVYSPKLFGAREERVLTLRQVELWTAEQSDKLQFDNVYMVENPSVFAELMEADVSRRDRLIPSAEPNILICGNGRPTTAVIKLLDALLSSGVRSKLFYAGDLDPAGLSIAENLQHRYPQAFRAWRMDRETYLRYAHTGIPLTDSEQSRLQDCLYNWDEELADVMRAKGVKLHQELWIKELLEDFESWK